MLSFDVAARGSGGRVLSAIPSERTPPSYADVLSGHERFLETADRLVASLDKDGCLHPDNFVPLIERRLLAAPLNKAEIELIVLSVVHGESASGKDNPIRNFIDGLEDARRNNPEKLSQKFQSLKVEGISARHVAELLGHHLWHPVQTHSQTIKSSWDMETSLSGPEFAAMRQEYKGHEIGAAMEASLFARHLTSSSRRLLRIAPEEKGEMAKICDKVDAAVSNVLESLPYAAMHYEMAPPDYEASKSTAADRFDKTAHVTQDYPLEETPGGYESLVHIGKRSWSFAQDNPGGLSDSIRAAQKTGLGSVSDLLINFLTRNASRIGITPPNEGRAGQDVALTV